MDILKTLTNEELLTLYKQAMSWYAVRQFVISGKQYKIEPDDFRREIEKRLETGC